MIRQIPDVRVLVGVIVVIGMIALAVSQSHTTTVVNETATTTTETVEVQPEWATDEEAVAAAQAVVERKKLEAEQAEIQGKVDALSERLTEIEKELGTY